MRSKLHMSLWNNIGPSIEPWGASDRICIRYFSSFFSQMFGNLKQTWRSYCERKSFAFSFPINNLCGRQSKAFERSVSKSPKTCSLFTLSFLSGGIGIKLHCLGIVCFGEMVITLHKLYQLYKLYLKNCATVSNLEHWRVAFVA